MGDSRGGVLSVVDLDAVLDELESQEEVKQNIPQVETEEQDLAAPSQGNLPPPSESSDIHPPATTVSVEAPLLVGLGDSETLSAGEEAPVASPSNPSDVGVEASSSPSSSSSTFESIYDNQPPSSEEADALPSVPPQPEVTDPDTSEGQEGAGNSADVPDDSVPPSTTGATPIPLESPPPYSELDPMVSRPNQLELPTPDQPATESATGAEAGSPGRTPNHPNPTESLSQLFQGMTEEQMMLGTVSPHWVPDEEAPHCMICENKFTLVRRRHHCRACGKVLCNPCCNEKAVLKCLEGKTGRVCKPCKSILQRLERAEEVGSSVAPNSEQVARTEPQSSGGPTPSSSGSSRPPNPNSPLDYCSTIPPLEQASASGTDDAQPTVMVPVGVLKRCSSAGQNRRGPGSSASGEVEGAVGGVASGSGEAKQVMFSDGIRPGGDLTELDGSSSSSPGHHPPRKHHSRRSKKSSHTHKLSTADVGRSQLPSDMESLPMVFGRGSLSNDEIASILENTLHDPIPFVINKNLIVCVKLINFSPVGKHIWSYRSSGLVSVGQDEIVFLLLQSTINGAKERTPPRDIFDYVQGIYEEAKAGQPVVNMGYSPIQNKFLGSNDYGGFLYIRHSFQCLDGLDLPASGTSFLFAILITKWEVPWARLFPLRLKLRLGAESRYYPAPIWSIRDRNTVYKEIGNTIMKLLIDFRNYTYSLPIIRGLLVLMEYKVTTVMIPKERYRQVQRALLNSNAPVLALGANFSHQADSHLVAIQTDEDHPPKNAMNSSDYETQAINIVNKTRKATGASFIVFNGALKSSSGLTAKSSIVEDGIMVQVSQDKMAEVRKNLEKMVDFPIECGPIGADQPDEVIQIKWIDGDMACNAGVTSQIDGKPFDGISSIRLHSGRDYVSDRSNHFIRWTEVFLLSSSTSSSEFDPPDPMSAATNVAKAVCHAMVPNLKSFVEEGKTSLSVRVTLDPEQVCYEAGSQGTALSQTYMNALDDTMIPVIHGEAANFKICFELLFQVLTC